MPLVEVDTSLPSSTTILKYNFTYTQPAHTALNFCTLQCCRNASFDSHPVILLPMHPYLRLQRGWEFSSMHTVRSRVFPGAVLLEAADLGT